MPFANQVTIMGNLTRDVEVKFLQSGSAVTEIGLAINDKRKNSQGEWVEETTFVDVTLWGRTAEVAGEYLKKGSPVYVEGRLKTDSWEAQGQKKSKLKVVGDKIQLIGGRGGSERGEDDAEQRRPHSKVTTPQQRDKPPYATSGSAEEPRPYPKNDNKRPPNVHHDNPEDDDIPF
jgi:single-strand DNA-binding protein